VDLINRSAMTFTLCICRGIKREMRKDREEDKTFQIVLVLQKARVSKKLKAS